MKFSEFLETVPPNKKENIEDLWYIQDSETVYLRAPRIWLYCDSKVCQGSRSFVHQALSQGLHEDTDDACLDMATAIRTILAKLSEKLSLVLKEEAELKRSLDLLINRRKEKEIARLEAKKLQIVQQLIVPNPRQLNVTSNPQDTGSGSLPDSANPES